jgi:thiamine kinase-like enzyme
MSPDSARALIGADVGTIDSIERIKHGLTNESWLVKSASGTFVIRCSNAAEDSLQIDRSSEAVILTAVALAGLGPDIVRNDPQQRVLVTRYAGSTWTQSDAVDERNVVRVAAVFRDLHRLAMPVGVRRVDLLDVVEGYLRTLDQHSAAGPSPEQRQRALAIAMQLRQFEDLCLCHNDVHALNIVDDGRLRFIDWEYAGLGERYFDLASLCVYHGYDRRLRERLLTAYDATTDAGALSRLEQCCWLFDCIRDLWTQVRELMVDDR